MDSGDFIYIIITLVIMIVGALKPKKKKAPIPKTYDDSEEDTKPSFIEQFLEEQFENIGERFDSKTQNETEVEELAYNQVFDSSPEITIEEAKYKSHYTSRRNEKRDVDEDEIKDYFQQEREDALLEVKEREEFNLKQAVIYSEILKTKYF